MTEREARRWLVNISLFVCGALGVFLAVAPALGFPMEFEQAMRLGEIVFPVFVGYIGSATMYLVRPQTQAQHIRVGESDLFRSLVKGPVLVFALVSAGGVVAFGYSNRLDAPPGTGMSVDTLALIVSGSLGLLTVSTSVLSAHLFATARTEDLPSGGE